MPATPFVELLKAELGHRLRPGAKTVPGLFAEDGVLEGPCAPRGEMHRTVGRTAIAAYPEGIQGSDGMTLAAAYHADGEEVAVLEYDGTAVNERNGAR